MHVAAAGKSLYMHGLGEFLKLRRDLRDLVF